jgi:hypothetical protein
MLHDALDCSHRCGPSLRDYLSPPPTLSFSSSTFFSQQHHHQKPGTTTLSSNNRRISSTFQTLNPTIHPGQSRPPKIGASNPFTPIVPCPPFLTSTINHPRCDSKRGPNLVLPPLRSMPWPTPKTGTMTLKTRPTRPLAYPLLGPITDLPSSQKYPSLKIGMMSWMEIGSRPRKRIRSGIHPTTRMASTLPTKRRIRQSPRVLAGALLASYLLRLPYHPSHAPWILSGRPSRAPQPCPFFPFPPGANPPHIPLWPISRCVPGAPLLLPCYPRVHLRKESADACEKSPVHLTTTFSSSLTGDKISRPYPPHLSRPLPAQVP